MRGRCNSKKCESDETIYFPVNGEDKGKAFFGFAFVVYGILLCAMLLSSVFMNLMSENWAKPELNTLQRIIPLVYLPAVVLYFARVRVYMIGLIVAYAYDLLFQFWSGNMSAMQLVIEYPVWTACVLLTVIFGVAYRGFKFRWWFGKIKKQNDKNIYFDD